MEWTASAFDMLATTDLSFRAGQCQQWRLVAKISGGAAPENCIFFINWGMATDIKLKDYILYMYKERIKEKRTHYMLSIISSGNRGCCSSTVPIREPPLGQV
jgi:hypothetical protein